MQTRALQQRGRRHPHETQALQHLHLFDMPTHGTLTLHYHSSVFVLTFHVALCEIQIDNDNACSNSPMLL
jgi:hypothetical protein